MSEPGMIPCDHVIAKLWEYIDGRLDGERRAEVEAHLDICARCFPEYDFRRAYRAFVQRGGPQTMPSEMRRRVFEGILEEERRTAGADAAAPAPDHSGGLRGLLRRIFGRG